MQEGEIYLEEYGNILISSWLCVFSDLETEQGIQGESWKNFVFKFWCSGLTTNGKNDEKWQQECPCTYILIWEQEVANIQGIGSCCLLHLRQVFLY